MHPIVFLANKNDEFNDTGDPIEGGLYESNTCIEHAAVYYDNQSS